MLNPALLSAIVVMEQVESIFNMVWVLLAIPIKNRMLRIIDETAAEYKLSLESNIEEE